MATTNLGQADHGVYAKALAAAAVDTVNFARDLERVEVWSDGTAAVYVTVDGTTPTVAGGPTFELPAGGPVVRELVVPTAGNTVVKLISAGAPRYSVAEASS